MIFRKWSVVECRDPGSNTGRTFFACLTQDAEGEIVESNLPTDRPNLWLASSGNGTSTARSGLEKDMTDALKPCPFCGPGNSVPGLWFDDTTNAYRVNCGACGSGTGFKPGWTEAEAIAAWNRRAPQPSPATDALADELENRSKICLKMARQASLGGDANDARRLNAKASAYAHAAELARADAALREREPVAWRVVWKNGQPDFRKTEAGARALARRFPDHEGKVQPLYAAPTLEHQEEQS